MKLPTVTSMSAISSNQQTKPTQKPEVQVTKRSPEPLKFAAEAFTIVTHANGEIVAAATGSRGFEGGTATFSAVVTLAPALSVTEGVTTMTYTASPKYTSAWKATPYNYMARDINMMAFGDKSYLQDLYYPTELQPVVFAVRPKYDYTSGEPDKGDYGNITVYTIRGYTDLFDKAANMEPRLLPAPATTSVSTLSSTASSFATSAVAASASATPASSNAKTVGLVSAGAAVGGLIIAAGVFSMWRNTQIKKRAAATQAFEMQRVTPALSNSNAAV